MTTLAADRYMEMDASLYLLGGLLVPAAIAAIVLTAVWPQTRRAVRLEPSEALWRE